MAGDELHTAGRHCRPLELAGVRLIRVLVHHSQNQEYGELEEVNASSPRAESQAKRGLERADHAERQTMAPCTGSAST